MMTNFPTNQWMNPAGLSAFLFIPKHLVKSIPSAISKIIETAIELKPDSVWFKGYSTLESLKFTEKTNQDDPGQSYEQSISGFMPGDTPELTDLFEEMEQLRHVVIIKDMLGKMRIVGLHHPLAFVASFSSGENVGDARGYSFEFYTESTVKAPFYRVS